MKPASDKQINFANRINIITGTPLPEEETAQAYFIYIRDNIDEYRRKKAIARVLFKSKTSRGTTSFLYGRRGRCFLGCFYGFWMDVKKKGNNYEAVDR